jgi:NAD+ synthase (glutamine-hydrolysing)
MALSNKFGSIVLTTGNKSEMATGYCTLYGDMAGGFAVIKDVAKTTVFRLARWRNAHDPYGTGATPSPSASSPARPAPNCARPDRPGQPAALRGAGRHLERYMENDQSRSSPSSPPALRAADVERVTRLIKINEYKRRQAPVGIRSRTAALARTGATLSPTSSALNGRT